MNRGFAAQRYFRPIHLENSGIAAGRGVRASDHMPGQKTEFHQAPGIVLRQVNAFQNRRFAAFERCKIAMLVAFQLHCNFSIH